MWPPGVWTSNVLSIPIKVLPPFYRSISFFLLLALLAAGLLYLFYRTRIERLLALEKLRTRIASNLHDELGSKVTRISIYADALKMSGGSGGEQTLTEINNLSRSVISTMSDVIWSVDSRFDRMDDLIARMKQFSEEMFSSKEIQFEFRESGIKADRKLNPFWRQQFFLVFKEAVNNICKHGVEVTKVQISLDEQQPGIRMRILDNGVQQEEKTKRRGQGMSNMESRAASLDGSFSAESTPAGFLVEVEVRLN